MAQNPHSNYNRQELIRGWDQSLLLGTRVLVVGAGTSGNEVLKNLALLGIGKITVVDYDLIEDVNLTRSVLFRRSDIGQAKATVAAQRVMELNPDCLATPLSLDVVHEFGNLEYRQYDCVIVTVDNLEARLWINRYCWMNGTPLINTGIGGLLGNVYVMEPQRTPCLECGWGESAYRRLSEKYSCLKLGIDNPEATIPMVVTTASVVAGIACQEMVSLLHGPEFLNGWRAGVNILFDGEQCSVSRWDQVERTGCPGHGGARLSDEDLNGAFDCDRDDLVSDIAHRLAARLGVNEIEIYSDHPIVYEAGCNRGCGPVEISPTPLFRFRRTFCESCGFLSVVPKRESCVLSDTYSFAQLGIPRTHLLRFAFVDETTEVRYGALVIH